MAFPVFILALSALQALQPVAAGFLDLGGSLKGTKEARPGQFPFHVGVWVYLDESGDKQAFCSGAILSEHIVITAAHCAARGKKFAVVTGAHDIREDGTEYLTSKKFVQESYQPSVQNDIALIYIEEGIEFSDSVQPIRLPSAEEAEEDFTNAEVFMTGWGSKNIGAASTLRYAKSSVITNRYCSNVYFSQYIKDSNICASGLWGKAACKLDDGGPMITYAKDGKATLLGVKSFSSALGCESIWPVVYTRVGWYVDWIADRSAAFAAATEAPAPVTAAPAPATEAPAPFTEAPAPVTEASAPATEVPAAATAVPAAAATDTDASAEAPVEA